MENQKLSILLVDDDSNEREGVRFLIERAGYPLAISEAPNGKRALDFIRTSQVDILFTDVKMPYMDGLELSAIVHQEFPQIKIIIFSAYGEFEYAKKAMEAKAVNYLLKPIDVEEFQSVMEAMIRRCQEDQVVEKQRQQRMLADRKLRWINILTGKQALTDTVLAELTSQGYPVNQCITLLYMEAQGNFFASREKETLRYLAENLDCRYEYVNVYPNSSFAILFAQLPKTTIRILCRKLQECAQEDGEQIAFFADDSYFALQDIADRVHKMKDLSSQMFIWEAGTLFMSDLAQLMQEGAPEIEEVWEQTSNAIYSHNKTIIMSHIHDLLDTMTSHGLFGTAYIHHVFYDLLGKLYTEYGCFDSGTMQETTRQLSRCHSKQALMHLVGSVLDALSLRNGTQQDTSGVVQKVKKIIKQEYSQDISLDYLGQSVGLAPSYLSYVFKKETGENIIKYLTDYRMEKAKDMLDDGRYKIVQVAKQCSYENQSYFNRLFKNAYGITPKQYREKKYGE